MPGTRVVLITRDGCHLCEQAAATIAEQLPADEVTTLDVDADEQVRARYTDHVPVVFLDQRLLAYWTLPPERLAAALDDPRWSSPPRL